MVTEANPSSASLRIAAGLLRRARKAGRPQKSGLQVRGDRGEVMIGMASEMDSGVGHLLSQPRISEGVSMQAEVPHVHGYPPFRRFLTQFERPAAVDNLRNRTPDGRGSIRRAPV